MSARTFLLLEFGTDRPRSQFVMVFGFTAIVDAIFFMSQPMIARITLMRVASSVMETA